MSSNSVEIHAALQTVHDPRSPSAQRFQAQQYLEQVKQDPLCAVVGFELSQPKPDGTNDAFVRHYGLALLEHAVRYQFHLFDEQKRRAVRDWVLQLAFGLTESDPHFIREKIAYLVVGIAKKTWGLDTRVTKPGSTTPNGLNGSNGLNNGSVTGLDGTGDSIGDGWPQFDAQLLELWNSSSVHREFSLSVLRCLFEDVFLLDDPVASGRAHILSTQCIEITASQQDLAEIYAVKAPELSLLRASNENEGWLLRWTQTLLTQPSDDRIYLKLVESVKACIEWVPATSILSSEVLKALIQASTHAAAEIRVQACDCLHILLHTRTYSTQRAFDAVINAVFEPDGMRWLSEVYSGCCMQTSARLDCGMEYIFVKKHVELVVGLGEYLEREKPFKLNESADLGTYFRLLLEICAHPSLFVSGQVLQFWCGVLRVEKLAQLPEVAALFPQLLQTASNRCINYENMPSSDLSKAYMDLDFDNKQEAVQFYRNYKRYMEDILRLLVCRLPVDGMQFLRNKMGEYFQSELGYKTVQCKFESEASKVEPEFVLGSAQFTLVEAAIRGAARWQVWAEIDEKISLNTQIVGFMAVWAQEMLELRCADLYLQRRTIECLVQFAPLLKENEQLLFRILERVLQACTCDLPPETPEYDDEREKVLELRMASGTELNRLAYMVPESLSRIYDQLEQVIAELISVKNVKEHESVSFKSFLLVASQRSQMPTKDVKFKAIVDPVLAKWTEESTMKGLASLEWFLERVGVVEIDNYFRRRQISSETDLLNTLIDDEGRQLKTELKQKWQQVFPIRPSRIFIQYTIERLDHQSKEYLYLLGMWKPRIQPILPHILQLIAQIMAYHDPSNWTQLPPEVQNFVKLSCTERFWQVGISMQTKAEFESANLAASRTLRDFADSVGHVVRYTREYAFLTLGSIAQLEETMYEVPLIGTTLARALTSTTAGVTCHAWRHMISLVVRNVVKNCPVQYTATFLPEFLPTFLNTMNRVLVEKWKQQELLGLQLNESNDDSELSEEMMDEYLLRQLTAITDRLLIDLVGQSSAKPQSAQLTAHLVQLDGANSANGANGASDGATGVEGQKSSVRRVCRNNLQIISAVLELCASLMAFKDSRCCFNTCLIVRHLLAGPETSVLQEVAPVFVSRIVPACLNVLNSDFFAESHLEAGTILTLMHVQLNSASPSPLNALASLLNVSNDKLASLNLEMTSAKSLRQQRGVLMEFLTQCGVLAVDDQSRERNKKRVEQRVSARNVMEEHYDSEALMNMFNI